VAGPSEIFAGTPNLVVVTCEGKSRARREFTYYIGVTTVALNLVIFVIEGMGEIREGSVVLGVWWSDR
jgi:hypothetical protein